MHTNVCPLVVVNGKLAYQPTNPEVIRWFKGEPIPLLYVYPEGDCDYFRWPLDTGYKPESVQIIHIAMAMFDDRECGRIGTEITACSLPDGRIVAL